MSSQTSEIYQIRSAPAGNRTCRDGSVFFATYTAYALPVSRITDILLLCYEKHCLGNARNSFVGRAILKLYLMELRLFLGRAVVHV